MADCLHCRIMAAVDEWREDNPDEESGMEILINLSEAMGHVMALYQQAKVADVKAALETVCKIVVSEFEFQRVSESAQRPVGVPKDSLH